MSITKLQYITEDQEAATVCVGLCGTFVPGNGIVAVI